MTVKKLIKRIIESSGYDIIKRDGSSYNQDGLRSFHNHDFVRDPSFIKAYRRGVLATDIDYRFEWRVHVALWVAYSASRLKGDFIECGVNRGFLSSAIMEFLDWNSLHKTFYLMDTFNGLDERYVSEEEVGVGRLLENERLLKDGFYTTNVDAVRKNFAQWTGVEIIVGSIPDSLDGVRTQAVAYLHLDMNCAEPEVAALDRLWERLVPGAFILLDDYAHSGYGPQKAAMDKAADRKQLKILSIPTGQGLLIKPAE